MGGKPRGTVIVLSSDYADTKYAAAARARRALDRLAEMATPKHRIGRRPGAHAARKAALAAKELGRIAKELGR
jgi:hypothetical protein